MKTWLKALLPFLFFVIGFYATALLIRRETFLVPSVVGLTVSEAVLVFSKPTAQLVPRILTEREDDTVSPGTVLAQMPRPGQRVKSQQCIYLTVSKSQQKLLVPDFVGITATEATTRAEQKRVRVKVLPVPDNAPADSVIAQVPHAGSALTDDPVLLYASRGTESSLRLVPDLTGMPVDEVTNLLAQQNIKITILDHPFSSGGGVVTAQRPLAGSIIDMANSVTVQVQVG